MSEPDDYIMEDARERYLQQNADTMSYDMGAKIGYVLQATMTAMGQHFGGATDDDALIIGEALIEQVIHDQELPLDMIDWDELHAGISAICLAYRTARKEKGTRA